MTQKATLTASQPCLRDKDMRDLTIGRKMGAQQHDKQRERKGIPPLLVCWLLAVGIMILVSSNGQSHPDSARQPAPTETSQPSPTDFTRY